MYCIYKYMPKDNDNEDDTMIQWSFWYGTFDWFC